MSLPLRLNCKRDHLEEILNNFDFEWLVRDYSEHILDNVLLSTKEMEALDEIKATSINEFITKFSEFANQLNSVQDDPRLELTL